MCIFEKQHFDDLTVNQSPRQRNYQKWIVVIKLSSRNGNNDLKILEYRTQVGLQSRNRYLNFATYVMTSSKAQHTIEFNECVLFFCDESGSDSRVRLLNNIVSQLQFV
jgi:hypothetical protein